MIKLRIFAILFDVVNLTFWKNPIYYILWKYKKWDLMSKFCLRFPRKGPLTGKFTNIEDILGLPTDK